ncbi:MAG: hypothetical protein CMO31_01570 [Trueperaceae bacterium]|jgi:hypothetical protein|nr:hypothetical protein [Trueperaceae bacterium]MCH2667602.1 DUF3208 domain-containing protein [Deinococcales bacterium]|tara:strand:- start:461 stop:805 length:345 start_codon:yes stop_codon:yes gene_type:complete
MTTRIDRKATKILQGYLWHPIELEITLTNYVPATLDPDIHILVDEMPRAPFVFFDDGTLTSSQQFYQFTVLTIAPTTEEPSRLVPWLAETLQSALEKTPEGVGWQIMEDLREVG